VPPEVDIPRRVQGPLCKVKIATPMLHRFLSHFRSTRQNDLSEESLEAIGRLVEESLQSLNRLS